jgi:hypothetical protein
MLGQSKINLTLFIKLVSLGSNLPKSTYARWEERLKLASMNNNEWPFVLKNINTLIDNHKIKLEIILQIIHYLELRKS